MAFYTFNKSRHIFAVDMQVLLEINKRFGVSSKNKTAFFQTGINPKRSASPFT